MFVHLKPLKQQQPPQQLLPQQQLPPQQLPPQQQLKLRREKNQ